MKNDEICAAINAVALTNILYLFNEHPECRQEKYKLCFSTTSCQLFFCCPPNTKYCDEPNYLLCELTEKEIKSANVKSIIISDIERRYGKCLRP